MVLMIVDELLSREKDAQREPWPKTTMRQIRTSRMPMTTRKRTTGRIRTKRSKRSCQPTVVGMTKLCLPQIVIPHLPIRRRAIPWMSNSVIRPDRRCVHCIYLVHALVRVRVSALSCVDGSVWVVTGNGACAISRYFSSFNVLDVSLSTTNARSKLTFWGLLERGGGQLSLY